MYIRNSIGQHYRGYEGDTRSLDKGSFGILRKLEYPRRPGDWGPVRGKGLPEI